MLAREQAETSDKQQHSILEAARPALSYTTYYFFDHTFRFFGHHVRTPTSRLDFFVVEENEVGTPQNIYNMSPTMAMTAPSAVYMPTSDVTDRHDYAVNKSRKAASTGGGRAWSEDEVSQLAVFRIREEDLQSWHEGAFGASGHTWRQRNVESYDTNQVRPPHRKSISSRLVSKRCLTSTLLLT